KLKHPGLEIARLPRHRWRASALQAQGAGRTARSGTGALRLLHARLFAVEVLFESVGGDGAIYAIGRHIRFGAPNDGVEDEFSEFVIAPVLVIMPPRKAEAASPIWPLEGPQDVLRFTRVLLHFRITAMRVIRARFPAGAVRRHRRQD